jgi:CRISPR-associated endonuclease/helicase Cas3
MAGAYTALWQDLAGRAGGERLVTPEIWAHTQSDEGQHAWQSLPDHLERTAQWAAAFGERIGVSCLAETAAWLHDVGKYSDEFQSYLAAAAELTARAGHRARPARNIDHKWMSSAAAAALVQGGASDAVSILVAGHHGGLPDRTAWKTRAGQDTTVVETRFGCDGLTSRLPPADCLQAEIARCHSPLQFEMLLRMAYSCLVDADCLDTENHFEPSVTASRGATLRVDELLPRLLAAQERMIASSEPTPVNILRAEVYRACLAAADQPSGCFRLTVPTGGGKTLSSLAFALAHAVAHGMDRVIYGIPYTSIIDQTVDVFQGVLGSERAVLAHYAGAFESGGGDDDLPDWRRLAADNWDAPVVVTTNVQLFESLLGARPGRCRKVHRIPCSVVVLDEVQTLPPRLLDPLLDVIEHLSSDWGTTFVLCSATQPAVGDVDKPGIALSDLREIVPSYPRHFESMRRVTYEVPSEQWSWDRLACEMRGADQCLAILNTRKDALAALDALDDPDAMHLSTLLTPAHRRRVLRSITTRLKEGCACRVISTQVVEAGVDLDFPVVYRAIGPLDRIIQAAGRCNREGRRETGNVVVFETEEGTSPLGEYRTGSEIARASLRNNGSASLHSPDTSTAYFRELYANVDLDAMHIQRLRSDLAFSQVDEKFHLISQDSVPVVIRNEVTSSLIEAIESGRPITRRSWTTLQPHCVTLPQHQLEHLAKNGLARSLDVTRGMYVWEGRYDEVRGLGDMTAESGALIS